MAIDGEECEDCPPRRPPLQVCPQCGWYAHGPYDANKCDPERGKFAQQLITKLRTIEGVTATQLGYGYGSIGVQMFGITLVVETWARGFTVSRVFWTRFDNAEVFAHLVDGLAEALGAAASGFITVVE